MSAWEIIDHKMGGANPQNRWYLRELKRDGEFVAQGMMGDLEQIIADNISEGDSYTETGLKQPHTAWQFMCSWCQGELFNVHIDRDAAQLARYSFEQLRQIGRNAGKAVAK